jgi:hypothetical protein
LRTYVLLVASNGQLVAPKQLTLAVHFSGGTMADKQPSNRQAAEQEAERVMREALTTGRWFHLPERLAQLRRIAQGDSTHQGKLAL